MMQAPPQDTEPPYAAQPSLPEAGHSPEKREPAPAGLRQGTGFARHGGPGSRDAGLEHGGIAMIDAKRKGLPPKPKATPHEIVLYDITT